jgi:hypothetical protein
MANEPEIGEIEDGMIFVTAEAKYKHMVASSKSNFYSLFINIKDARRAIAKDKEIVGK